MSISADDVELALVGVQYGQRSILQQGDDGRLITRSALWSRLSRADRLKPLELLRSSKARLATEIEDSRFSYLFVEAQIDCLATASAKVMIDAEGFGELGRPGTGEELSKTQKTWITVGSGSRR